jgi:bacterioferritin-associated ferredoxin
MIGLTGCGKCGRDDAPIMRVHRRIFKRSNAAGAKRLQDVTSTFARQTCCHGVAAIDPE